MHGWNVKNLEKLKQYYYFHAKFFLEVQYTGMHFYCVGRATKTDISYSRKTWWGIKLGSWQSVVSTAN